MANRAHWHGIRWLWAIAATSIVYAPAQLSAAVPQGAPLAIVPTAIVPVDTPTTAQSPTVTGAIEVTDGKAIIATSGSVTSGTRTTEVTLPRRGVLRVCAATTVKLAADTSVPAGGLPGLLMAMDHGAVEMSLANTREAANADILMTPDFRILVSGPGTSEVKVRLGRGGDTCVDNSGAAGENAPYVVVTSLFAGGLYRVQPGQRVMFQHGSLNEVVDAEKEPCGCPPPPPAKKAGNEFPLAQSEGLAPMPPVPDKNASQASAPPLAVPPLVYPGGKAQESQAIAPAASAAAAPAPASKPANTAKKKPGFFTRLGRFFQRIFGAE